MSAAVALTVYHLLVGEHGLVIGAPIHRSLLLIHETLLIELQEKPLRPFVVFGRVCRDLARPVERCSHRLDLTFHKCDVAVGPCARIHLVLDSGIFGRKSEGIEADRIQHVLALHTLEARQDVGHCKSVPVSHMEIAGGIREFYKQVEILLARYRIGSGIDLVLRPELLPFLFYRLVIVFHSKSPACPSEALAKEGHLFSFFLWSYCIVVPAYHVHYARKRSDILCSARFC